MKKNLPGYFLLMASFVYGCGSKIDGTLIVQPIWPCELDPANVEVDAGWWCLKVIHSDGSEGEESCSEQLEGIQLVANEENGLVRLKLEAWDKFKIVYARGISVPVQLESGKENIVPVAMSMTGRFSLIAGNLPGCQPLPFHVGLSPALALPSGHLLAAGCADTQGRDDASRCALLVDPSNYRMVALSTPPSGRRYGHRMVALKDGRVLVIGGRDMNNHPLKSILVLRGGENFLQPYQMGIDYSLAKFEELPIGLKNARDLPLVATVFFDNQVLVNDSSGNRAEMWLGSSESSDYISFDGPDPFPYQMSLGYAQAVASVDESRAVVLGGVANHEGLLAATKDSRQVSFLPFGIPLEARNAPVGVVIDKKDAIFIGGKENSVSIVSPVLALDINSRQLREVSPYKESFPRAGFTATLLPDGRILVAGGISVDPDVKQGVTFIISQTGDPNNPWKIEIGPDLRMPRAFHASALLPDGRVILMGGVSTNPEVDNEQVMLSAEVITF